MSTPESAAETLPNVQEGIVDDSPLADCGCYYIMQVKDIDTIENLCARHGITVEGIVALVDEVFSPDNDSWLAARHVSALRRLARGEEA